MNRVKHNLLAKLEQALTEHELQALREYVQEIGYPALSELLEQLKERFKYIEDHNMEQYEALLRQATSVIPNPGTISPSWEHIWTNMEHMIRYKKEALQAIPAHQREGEWQVIMDNPFTNEAIVCYPGLSFLEAAYLYSYFRPDLKKNEIIRLQKIENLLVYNGD